MRDFFMPNSEIVRYRKHLQRNLKLAVPVMITQAGQVMVNLVDNIMVGGLGGRFDYIVDDNLGKTALGAVSLGNAVFITTLVVAFGFSFAISPLIAAADSKKDTSTVSKIFTHGLGLNLILAVLLLIVLEFISPLLYYMGQPQDVINMALPYLSIMAWSLIPIMIFQTFRQFSEGLSLTIPVTIATLIGNVINVLFNYAMIYGNWGFPRMEVAGAGWGTFIARVSMLIIMILVLYNFKKSKMYLKEIRFKVMDHSISKQLLKLGIPTAFSSFFEVSAFSGAAFICGYALTQDAEGLQSAKTNLAAHQIAISLASVSFMMCMGLGVAATVRVANQLGLKNYKIMREAGFSSILMAVIFMGICGIAIIALRYKLPFLYLDDPEVIQLAATLLIVAALFQLSDGIQLVALGALRGMQNVLIPSIITFVAYWMIALPLGALLAIYFELQALGMWIGLLFGLTVSAIMLLLRFHKQTKKLNYASTQISNRR